MKGISLMYSRKESQGDSAYTSLWLGNHTNLYLSFHHCSFSTWIGRQSFHFTIFPNGFSTDLVSNNRLRRFKLRLKYEYTDNSY